MKPFLTLAAMLMLLTSLVACSSAQTQGETQPGTNLDNTAFFEYYEEDIRYVSVQVSEKEYVHKDYIGLFVNGSLVENANLIEVDGQLYAPLEPLVSALGGNSEYFDGSDSELPHIINHTPHVMVSRSAEGAVPSTSEAAASILKEQLNVAFDSKFNGKTDTTGDKELLRNAIDSLAVSRENDRFYVFNVVWEFWVDKYTGEVFVYYDGLHNTISRFDPNSENALSFAG